MEHRFSNRDLKILIIPLVIEQFLQISIGLIDSLMIAGIGDAAVSGVSLVDSVFVLFIDAFAALAAGGAVVAGQYIGMKDVKKVCEAAWQMIISVTAMSLIVMALIYVFQDVLLYGVFGEIDDSVRANSKEFLLIVTASIPFIALYNAGSSIFRVMGNTKLPMKMALFMNIVNIIGNALLLYGFDMGVSGIAIPTLISRAAAATIIICLLRNPNRLLHLPEKLSLHINLKMQKRILKIGIPNGMETAMFEFGKILVLSLVATLGTPSIAANAVGNYVGTFAIMAGFAVGNATITVISQCVGAREYDQVRYYKKKMMRICYALIIASNVIVIALLPLILKVYDLSDEASRLAFTILVYHGICACFIWAPSFLLPYVLRAANDVAPAMIIAMVSVWIFRVVVAYILVKVFGMGLLGVWIAMTTDWAFRSICFTIRYRQEKWLIKSEKLHK